jgi:DNA-binding IclR family transcriptional regulator
MEEKIKASRRMLRLIVVLGGHEVDGLRPKQIREAMGIDAAAVTRDLADMKAEGFAERVPGREEAWRLGPKAIQIFRAYTLGIERMRARLEETEQRYSRLP